MNTGRCYVWDRLWFPKHFNVSTVVLTVFLVDNFSVKNTTYP